MEYIIDVPDIYVETDKIIYSQIIINLVGNSIKFTEKGGITIKVIEEINANDINIITQVVDTGMGIKKEMIDKLFNPFCSIDNDRSTKYVGTGLGLAICKKSIERMGGNIHVNSIEGEGSTFTFNFKTVKKCDANIIRDTLNVDDSFDETYGEKYPLKILVCDDVKVNRYVVTELLKKFGYYDIDNVSSGNEVLDIIKEKIYDLIFLDIRMGGMDGVTTMDVLKKTYNNLPPIVALTANSLTEDLELYKNMGMYDSLTKPIDLGQLKKLLKNIYDYNILSGRFD